MATNYDDIRAKLKQLKKGYDDNYDDIRAKSKQLKKSNAIIKIFVNLLNNSPNDTSVYDLIGETLIEDPPFFMNKVYNKVYVQNQKMQQYILQKFSFFEKEAFVTASDGNVRQNKILIKGRFYITNYRIIAQGIMVAKTGMLIMGGLLGGVLGAAIQQHLISYLRISAYKGQQKILDTASEEKKACFGYQFPIFRAYNINRTISAVKYKVDTEFEHKGKVKKKTMAMTVTPKKNKGEKGIDFNVRKEEVLSKITELLNSNSVM